MSNSKATKGKTKVSKKDSGKSIKTNKLNIKLIAAVFVAAGLIGGYITYKNIANAGVLYTWSATQFEDMSSGSLVKKSNGSSWWEPGKDSNGFAWVASTVNNGHTYCAELGGDGHKVRLEVIQNNALIGSTPYRYPSEWQSATGRRAACLYVTGTSEPGRRIGVRYNRATTSGRDTLTVNSITREN